jgi:hypothetical protein
MALSLVEAKGHSVAVGLSAYKEYRGGDLSIIYLPRFSHLDVCHRRKVLTINRRAGALRVIHFNRGEWEDHLDVWHRRKVLTINLDGREARE